MQTVEFKHAVGSEVVIKISGTKGLVRGNYIGQYGQKETLVEYADKNGVIHKDYITENEVI